MKGLALSPGPSSPGEGRKEEGPGGGGEGRGLGTGEGRGLGVRLRLPCQKRRQSCTYKETSAQLCLPEGHWKGGGNERHNDKRNYSRGHLHCTDLLQSSSVSQLQN